MSFTDLMSFVNYAFVLFFGIIVSLYLADFPFEEHKRFYTLTLLGFGIAQIIFYLALGEKALYQSTIDPSSINTFDSICSEAEYLCIHDCSTICLSAMYTAKMDRYIGFIVL